MNRSRDGSLELFLQWNKYIRRGKKAQEPQQGWVLEKRQMTYPGKGLEDH